MVFMALNKVNQGHIKRLGPCLEKIFADEIEAGNVVVETYIGDWPFKNSVMVFLKKPFLTPIRSGIQGVKYTLVNDSHYWKAQYHHLDSNTILCCGFDGPDFGTL